MSETKNVNTNEVTEDQGIVVNIENFKRKRIFKKVLLFGGVGIGTTAAALFFINMYKKYGKKFVIDFWNNSDGFAKFSTGITKNGKKMIYINFKSEHPFFGELIQKMGFSPETFVNMLLTGVDPEVLKMLNI